MKKLLVTLMCVVMLVALMPTMAFAANGYVTVNGDATQYTSIDEAVAAANAENGEVTYYIYGAVEAKGTNEKYTPDMALDGSATKVNVIGKTDDAKITLTGVYYQKFAAEGADLYVEGVILDDDRDVCGEGQDPDPWEFTNISIESKSVKFVNCKFYECISVSIDATFEKCYFTVMPEYYKDFTRTFTGYTKEEVLNTDWSKDHYSLWIHNYGDVIVDGCTFENVEYGGIKSTWNKYNNNSGDADLTLTVKNTTFKNVGVAGDHAPVHLDGAKTVEFVNNTIIQCVDNGSGEYVNVKTADTVIDEEGNVVGDYAIVYDLDGGVVSIANPTVYSDETAEFTLNNPTKAGYKFLGWTGSNGETPETVVKIKGADGKDLSFKANWEVVDDTQTPITPEAPKTEVPKTGDMTDMMPWLAVMAVTVVGAIYFKRREN